MSHTAHRYLHEGLTDILQLFTVMLILGLKGHVLDQVKLYQSRLFERLSLGDGNWNVDFITATPSPES